MASSGAPILSHILFLWPTATDWKETYTQPGGVMNGILPAMLLLPTRLLMLVLWFGVVLWSLIAFKLNEGEKDGSPMATWPVFLTHWGATLELAYLVLLSLTTFMASATPVQSAGEEERGGGEGEREEKASSNGDAEGPSPPLIVTLTWILGTLMRGGALMITLSYWLLVFPTLDAGPAPIGYFTHGFNSVLMACDLLSSRQPSHIGHAWLLMLLGAIYLVFNFCYYQLGGKGPGGAHYIYAAIDWQKPGKTLILSMVIVFVVAPFVHFLQWSLAKGAEWLGRSSPRTVRDTSQVQLSEVSAEASGP